MPPSNQRLLNCAIARRVKKLFTAGWTRAGKNDANDTRALSIQRLVEIRAQQAETAWFSSLCRMENRRSMAKNPEAAAQLYAGNCSSGASACER
ncbi:hypothetical protein DMI70_23875 [Escherichia coli]|nr:hypothetical protein [Escherichia coli]